MDLDHIVIHDPQPCPVCASPFGAASRGRIGCTGGHVFTLRPIGGNPWPITLDDVIRIDNLPEAEAEAHVMALVDSVSAAPWNERAS